MGQKAMGMSRYSGAARAAIGSAVLLLLALFLLSLPVRPGDTVLFDIGTAEDRSAVSGMQDPESGEGSTFRWTSRNARLTLPPFEAPFLLTFRLTPAPLPDGQAVELTVQVDEEPPLTFTVSGKMGMYHVLVDAPAMAYSGRVVYLRSNAALQTVEDTREKSVALHWVGVRTLSTGWILSPCPALFLEIALLVVLLYLGMLAARMSWKVALGLAGAVPVAVAVFLWRAPALGLLLLRQAALPALVLAAAGLAGLLLAPHWDRWSLRLRQVVTSPRLRITLLIILAAMVAGSIGLKLRAYLIHPSAVNIYTLQAEAFLQGKVSVRPHYYDLAVFRGLFYVPFPPAPALILLPTTALFGITPLQVIFANVVLTVLNVILLVRILRRLEVAREAIPWIVGAFFLGTAYWLSVVKFSETYFIAHIVAVTGMFLAIHEGLGRGRGFLVGLFLGIAFLSRQLCLCAVPFLLAALWINAGYPTRSRKLGNVLFFALSLAGCVGVYLAFNWIRFGSILDTGYAYIPLQGFLKERVDQFGQFNLAYFPFNFVHMFLQGFHVKFDSSNLVSGIQMDPFGTSLTFASPFILLAFWGRWEKHLLQTAWVSILLGIVPMLFYYNNGWIQANAQRFTLDFLPLLILLVALGTKRVQGNIWKAAIAVAVFLNTLALFWIPLLQSF